MGASKREPGWYEMTATRLAVARLKVNEARCEALFASGLQPSDAPTAGMVAEAIGRAVQRFGIRRCAGRMAQEFGDHPDAAAERIRWVRRLAAWAAARPQASLGAGPPGQSPGCGVAPAGGGDRAGAAAGHGTRLDGHDATRRRDAEYERDV